MTIPLVLVLAAVATIVASGYFAAYVASEKGYSFTVWFWCGLLFSIPALIAVAGLPDRNKESVKTGNFDEFKSNLPKLE